MLHCWNQRHKRSSLLAFFVFCFVFLFSTESEWCLQQQQHHYYAAHVEWKNDKFIQIQPAKCLTVTARYDPHRIKQTKKKQKRNKPPITGRYKWKWKSRSQYWSNLKYVVWCGATKLLFKYDQKTRKLDWRREWQYNRQIEGKPIIGQIFCLLYFFLYGNTNYSNSFSLFELKMQMGKILMGISLLKSNKINESIDRL